jgi:hypothetical protein
MGNIGMEESDRLIELFNEKYNEDKIRFKTLPGVTEVWTPNKIVKLYECVSNDDDVTVLADELGIQKSAVTRKINTVDWDKFGEVLDHLCHIDKFGAIKYEAKEFQDRMHFREDIKERNKLITKEAFYSNLHKDVLEKCKGIALRPLPPVSLHRNTKNRTPEHVVLLLSDLHVGQEFTLEETGGINAYNIDVFYKRAESLQNTLMEIIDLHSSLYELPELHIFSLGDNVQGATMNGEWGGAYSSHISVTDQAVIAAKTLGQLIREWSRYFKKITFNGVIGNHGRAGPTKNSDPISASWDNVVYIALNGECSQLKNVSINWSKTWWDKQSVLGTEFLLVHGDYFGNSMNALLTANQKLADLIASIPGSTPFNVLCLGHFHSHTEIETSLGRIIVNGSFVGPDMYSLHQMRVGSRPTQTILGVHPRRGLTWKYCLDLDKGHKGDSFAH